MTGPDKPDDEPRAAMADIGRSMARMALDLACGWAGGAARVDLPALGWSVAQCSRLAAYACGLVAEAERLAGAAGAPALLSRVLTDLRSPA